MEFFYLLTTAQVGKKLIYELIASYCNMWNINIEPRELLGRLYLNRNGITWPDSGPV
jgi:hypothetical protein